MNRGKSGTEQRHWGLSRDGVLAGIAGVVLFASMSGCATADTDSRDHVDNSPPPVESPQATKPDFPIDPIITETLEVLDEDALKDVVLGNMFVLEAIAIDLAYNQNISSTSDGSIFQEFNTEDGAVVIGRIMDNKERYIITVNAGEAATEVLVATQQYDYVVTITDMGIYTKDGLSLRENIEGLALLTAIVEDLDKLVPDYNKDTPIPDDDIPYPDEDTPKATIEA